MRLGTHSRRLSAPTSWTCRSSTYKTATRGNAKAAPLVRSSCAWVEFAGHLGRELEVCALPVCHLDRLAEDVAATRRLSNGVLRRKPEHRARDLRRRAVRARKRLELEVADSRDRAGLVVRGHASALHAHVLADQRLELAEGTAGLTGEDLLERLRLVI